MLKEQTYYSNRYNSIDITYCEKLNYVTPKKGQHKRIGVIKGKKEQKGVETGFMRVTAVTSTTPLG